MKKFIIPLIIVIGAGGLIGYNMYNKEHEKTASLKANVEITATDLVSNYENDETLANSQYLDKVIAVTGTVMKIDKTDESTSIILDGGNELSTIICQLEDPDAKLPKEGQEVTIKGLCTGFLMDVVLVRAVII